MIMMKELSFYNPEDKIRYDFRVFVRKQEGTRIVGEVDFDIISKVVQKSVIDRLDHNYLEVVTGSSHFEDVLLWMSKKLIPVFHVVHMDLIRLELDKSPTSMVVWEKSE
tara:strand:- start:1854 stop:2180 length:327 start_codon:yes stop_codon:yes gene_type:complete